MIKYFKITFSLLLLISCNRIENSKTLDKEDLIYIKNLKLLENGETINNFYSEYKKKVAGNFYTNRRVATYWIDERSPKKNEINFAYYKDILKIDTVYNVGLTYTPYISITKIDGSTFKVSVNGNKEEVKNFFEGVIKEWKKNK